MNAQFKKRALELCVLSQLNNADRYGYQLTDAVSQEMAIAPGTLYLVLKRLKEESLVETYLVESDEGPARKYYRIKRIGGGPSGRSRVRREKNNEKRRIYGCFKKCFGRI